MRLRACGRKGAGETGHSPRWAGACQPERGQGKPGTGAGSQGLHGRRPDQSGGPEGRWPGEEGAREVGAAAGRARVHSGWRGKAERLRPGTAMRAVAHRSTSARGCRVTAAARPRAANGGAATWSHGRVREGERRRWGAHRAGREAAVGDEEEGRGRPGDGEEAGR